MTEKLFDHMFVDADPALAPPLIVSDGGRAAAGFSCRRRTGDCVTRAIAHATTLPYAEVYAGLWAEIRRAQAAGGHYWRGMTPRSKGLPREIWTPYLQARGWEWVPSPKSWPECMRLRVEDLPSGWIVVHCLQHLVALCDGVMYDDFDHSRGGSMPVFGYFHTSTT